jgi:hypothetical protein
MKAGTAKLSANHTATISSKIRIEFFRFQTANAELSGRFRIWDASDGWAAMLFW